MIVTDRSNGSEGAIQSHGCTHLATSDKGAANDGARTAVVGEGQTSQAPRIPSFHPYSENSAVEGELEPCTAVVVDLGGDAGNGTITQGADFGKTMPVIAVPSGPGNFTSPTKEACAAAHVAGSYTKDDHATLHGSGDSAGVSKALDKVTKSASATQPATFQMGKQNFSNNQARPSANKIPTMAEVVHLRRMGHEFADKAIDCGLPVKRAKPVLTGPAVSNPGENTGRHGFV
jgi:hypothetical protein